MNLAAAQIFYPFLSSYFLFQPRRLLGKKESISQSIRSVLPVGSHASLSTCFCCCATFSTRSMILISPVARSTKYPTVLALAIVSLSHARTSAIARSRTSKKFSAERKCTSRGGFSTGFNGSRFKFFPDILPAYWSAALFFFERRFLCHSRWYSAFCFGSLYGIRRL